MRTRSRLLVCVPALLAAVLWPAASGAQEGRPCVVVFSGVVRGGVVTTSMRSFTAAGGVARQVFVSGGVDATCEGQGNRLLADSAEHYADRGELILINRVRYSEPRMSMQSDRMIYYTGEERLFATGNVRGRTNTGTRFTGPQFEYFRAKPGMREQPHWRAPGRPFVRMPQQQAPGAARPAAFPSPPAAPRTPAATAVAPDSVDLTADVIVSQNDSLVWLSGKVIIERPDLLATADSATLDQGIGYARLIDEPRIVGRGERPFTLTGIGIDLWSKDQKVDRVLSSGEARVVSDSLTLTSDTIDLRIADQKMERVFAWGVRARADTPEQQIDADSLDITMPGQRLRELHAIGKAIAWTRVDSTKVVSEERDWISGDTIIARFDTVATGDTTSAARMREVTSTGSARAFYQLAPSGGEKGLPNLSYNRGREIIVSFTDGEVQNVDVKDKASGLFLEPLKTDTTRAASAPGKPPTKPAPTRP